jgi:type I restriction enzyme M protein
LRGFPEVFENTFKKLDDILRKDKGCSTEMDYVEQSSWVLFLKYLDDLERDREAAAILTGEPYEPLLPPKLRWAAWAAPRGADGRVDLNVALTGDDLLAFVNGTLWPYLARFRTNVFEFTPQTAVRMSAPGADVSQIIENDVELYGVYC